MHLIRLTLITIQLTPITKHINYERPRRLDQINEKKKLTIRKISERS